MLICCRHNAAIELNAPHLESGIFGKSLTDCLLRKGYGNGFYPALSTLEKARAFEVTAATTSVIIPVLNGAAFIGAAIESVLAQLTESDQVIVIDDGSVDATPDILRTFAGRSTVLQGPKRGVSAARNLGLRNANREFVAFLDHDDLWPPGRHSALLSALMTDPTYNAAAGRIRILTDTAVSGADYLSWDGTHQPGFLWAALFSRSLVNAAGWFDETMAHGEDNDFYIRLQEANMRMKLCDVDALCYRRHSGNATNSAPPKSAVFMDIISRAITRRRKSGTASQTPPTSRE
jgi:glycosyltransferase involved in cell wall biosynthesis